MGGEQRHRIAKYFYTTEIKLVLKCLLKSLVQQKGNNQKYILKDITKELKWYNKTS